MPKVNIKYKFLKDALINTIHYIRFQGKVADLNHDQQSYDHFEGKVENVWVTDRMDVEVLLGGPAGNWSLDVSVIKIGESAYVKPNGEPIFNEIGDYKKLVIFPIIGDIAVNPYYDRVIDINW